MELAPLTPEDIERCRTNPFLFVDNPYARRNAILDQFCGPMETFVFKRQDCSDSPNVEEAYANRIESHISNYMRHGLWRRAAQLMWFFKVAYFKIGILVDCNQFPPFIEAFEFNCFPVDLTVGCYNAAEEWCQGLVGPRLVRRVTCTSIPVPDEVFELVLAKLNCRNMTTREAYDIVDAMEYHDTNPDRKQKVSTLLAQWRFKLSDDEFSARPYSFLMAKDQDLSKPVWSRSWHLQLATDSFKKETFTILLMRRWRPTEFPLHKDLVNILLAQIFDLHVADSVNLLAEFDRVYAKVSGWRKGVCERFYLKHGIHVRHTPHYNPNASLDRRSDAVYLKLGIPIGSEKMNGYAEDLRRGLCRQAFPNETVDTTFRGNAIIEYCKVHDIELFDVLKRRVILKSDQITAELTHEDGEILSDSDEEYYPWLI
jgi:hypothetical protein